jgi:hypothetical protein
VTTDVHQLDDGAWISVDGSREVNVSDLWLLAEQELCGCTVADFLAEGVVEVSVAPRGPDVQARFAGRCIQCGTEGVTGWLTVGRADPREGTFRGVDPGSVHLVDPLRHNSNKPRYRRAEGSLVGDGEGK